MKIQIFFRKKFEDWKCEIKTAPKPAKVNNSPGRCSKPPPPPPPHAECRLQSERECRRVRRAKSYCAHPRQARPS